MSDTTEIPENERVRIATADLRRDARLVEVATELERLASAVALDPPVRAGWASDFMTAANTLREVAAGVTAPRDGRVLDADDDAVYAAAFVLAAAVERFLAQNRVVELLKVFEFDRDPYGPLEDLRSASAQMWAARRTRAANARGVAQGRSVRP